MGNYLRDFTKKTNRGFIIGFIAILFLVGDGLIYLLYGKESAIFGLICIGGGLIPLVIIWGAMNLIEKLAKMNSVDEVD